MTFTLESQTGTFELPIVSVAEDSFKAGGSGYYDILLDFAERNRDRFGANESLTYIIGGPSGFSIQAFNALSTPGGGYGPFLVAAHVQAIAEDGGSSAWITGGLDPNPFTVPEPATVTLLSLGGVALVMRRRHSL